MLEVRLFATLKDKVGKSRISVAIEDGGDVEAMLATVAEMYPDSAETLTICVVSVNRAFADRDTPVTGNDEVALFPPVSGG